MLTQEVLKQLMHYDPEAGIFTWLRTGSGRRKDRAAGFIHGLGYRMIKINYQLYMASRLAWLYVHGEFPPEFMDHINQNRSDDRICNLRPATNGLNQANAKTRWDNTVGQRGVSWFARQRVWRVCVGPRDGQITKLFHSLEEAKRFAHEMHVKIFGEYSASGKGV